EGSGRFQHIAEKMKQEQLAEPLSLARLIDRQSAEVNGRQWKFRQAFARRRGECVDQERAGCSGIVTEHPLLPPHDGDERAAQPSLLVLAGEIFQKVVERIVAAAKVAAFVAAVQA